MSEKARFSIEELEEIAAKCENPLCRRIGTEPGCLGYHCPKCGGPCGMMGHETCPPSTGTAPQRPKADPQMVTCFQCRGDGTCFATDDPCPVCGGLGSITDDAAPAPQTEGECPQCGGDGWYGGLKQPHCPTCSGTGKEKAA